jgi:chromosome partitioning protein
VRIIDADPQGTINSWSKGDSKYRDIVVTPTAGEDLTDLIDRLAAAMSRADLVIIPMHGKTADAEVATNAIALLRKQEKLFQRRIDHGILFMATAVWVKTREEKEIRKDIEARNIPCFQTDLNERTAFSHIIRFKLAVDELTEKETNGLEAALENADSFANEVIHILRKRKEEAA